MAKDFEEISKVAGEIEKLLYGRFEHLVEGTKEETEEYLREIAFNYVAFAHDAKMRKELDNQIRLVYALNKNRVKRESHSVITGTLEIALKFGKLLIL